MDSTRTRRGQAEGRPPPRLLPAATVLPAAPWSAHRGSLRFSERTDRTGTGRTFAVDTRTR